MFSGGFASGQESPVWDKPLLRDSVVALLSRYQVLHNQLKGETDPAVEREFVRLFSNVKVQVVNDIENQSQPSKISIDDFIFKVTDLFPEGLNLTLNLAALWMDQPVYDRNNRYLIRVRLNRTLNGISKGKVFSSDKKIIFQIAFFFNNNTPVDFAIYGMDLPPKGQSMISVAVSPAFTGFQNSTLRSDERYGLEMGQGYSAGISYCYYFSDHFGIGAGMQFSAYSGKVTLDYFDALGIFNPNMKDVVIDNKLWLSELPVFASFRTNPARKIVFSSDLGLFLGVRVFESMSSSSVNVNNGSPRTHVLSDSEWIGKMNRVSMGLQASIAVKYNLNKKFGIFIGGGYRRGLSTLDSNSQPDFMATRYLGQYNPLWGAPGKTVNQAFYANMGATVLIKSERTK
jgi:hypothetical protein